VSVTWSADGRTFEYDWDGRAYRYDLAARRATEIGAASEPAGRGGRGGRGAPGAPERGRQFKVAESPDKALRAVYHEDDRNLYLVDVRTNEETPLTTDGSRERRIKYGTASWVYGEELSQTTAMWWSPDGRKLAFYRFDESSVPDYYLPVDQTKLQSAVDTEAYPKAGAANPIVDLLIYDVGTKKATKVDVRDGKPFESAVVGYYAYRVAWSPDGTELLFNRTNRRQNVLELAAANPDTGAVRVVIREEWPTGWVENTPAIVFLKDGRRFIWESERNGWNNFYLYNLSGTLIAPLTAHTTFEASTLIKVDEEAGVVYYTARDGDNPLKLQLHRVGLDGAADRRLTDPKFHHTVGSCLAPGRDAAEAVRKNCGIAPDNRYFVDVYQTHDTPPATRLVDASNGTVLVDLASSDMSKFGELGLKKAEMFTFKSADGQTTLRGLIQFPSTFDPARKYPVIVPVYGGPGSGSNTARETFVMPNALTEYGFLVVNLDSRSAPGRGKRTLDQIYLKLGQVEVDDMAAGIRALATRSYVDSARVGIYGTSYGGYTSLMSLLRYPDVYAAASASSPVTTWNHYDTIYTERYMWIPQENASGYEAGSAMTYVKNLKGRLMLYYGTADNNVHPSNMMQLIAALQ
ncbi:MAG: DPP IV N-terminal domain-containing protein, partial [Vicinamibacterales bacterium]